MHGGELAPCEGSTTVEIIDALTSVTAPDGQATATIDTKEAGVGARRLAVRAQLTDGMEMLLQPGDALVVIKEVDNRKVHTLDLTSFALLV